MTLIFGWPLEAASVLETIVRKPQVNMSTPSSEFLEDSPVFESELSMPLSKESQTLIEFYMELLPHQIMIRTSKDKPVSGSIVVEYCKLSLAFNLNKGKKIVHMVELSSGTTSTCLYSSSKELILEWARHLKRFTVCYDFERDFEPRDKVGEGTYGTVITAKNKNDGRHYAAKKLEKCRIRDNPAELAFILNELKLMSVIEHTDVVRLIAVYEDQDVLYLVTNLFTGNELLLKVLLSNGLGSEEAIYLGHRLLLILNYLEQKQIIHHDIKPQNLIFRDSSETSDMCLIDFGLAAKVSRENLCHEVNGTKGFMAPEVAQGLPHDTRADVYSAGILIYFMLTAEMLDEIPVDQFDNYEPHFTRIKKLHKRLQEKKGYPVPAEGNQILT